MTRSAAAWTSADSLPSASCAARSCRSRVADSSSSLASCATACACRSAMAWASRLARARMSAAGASGHPGRKRPRAARRRPVLLAGERLNPYLRDSAFETLAAECRDRCQMLLGAGRVGCRARGLVQRPGELVPSGAGPVRGEGRLVGVPRDLAGLPVPVGLLDLRRFLLAATSSRSCSSRSASRIAGRPAALSGALPARCAAPPAASSSRCAVVQLLLGGREGLLGGGEVPAELLVSALRQPRPGGLALGRHLRVPAVVAEEGGRRLLRLGQGRAARRAPRPGRGTPRRRSSRGRG